MSMSVMQQNVIYIVPGKEIVQDFGLILQYLQNGHQQNSIHGLAYDVFTKLCQHIAGKKQSLVL